MSESPPRTDLPEHVTLPLLTLVTRTSLDQDYAYVASRREARGEPRTRDRISWIGVASVVAVFGLLVSTAAMQTSRRAELDATSRAALIQQIQERRADMTSVQDRIGTLRAQTTRLTTRVDEIESTLADTEDRATRIRAGTGYASVIGPGLRITVDDSPSRLEEEAVQGRDLAMLVNALWGSGAEAIAINGQRITPLTAVRNSNVAINVNSRPLAPPYVVDAIGDPDVLPAAFVDDFQAQRFFALSDAVGLRVKTATVALLRVPAAPGPRLRYLGPNASVDNGGVREKERGAA